MKKNEKIMALMLAAIMMMAMSVTAFCRRRSNTSSCWSKHAYVNSEIRSGVPTQTLKDQTIYLYKLFDVTESGTTGSKNYAYTVIQIIKQHW